MKTLKIWILIIMVVTISCEKEKENGPDTQVEKSDIDSGMPGNHIVDMQIDANNNYYFVTLNTEFRFDQNGVPIPFKSYLSRKTDEIGEFEILDSNFIRVDRIIFDKNNNLWGFGLKGLFLIKNNICNTIIKLDANDGLFTHIAVDENNNIWVGGLMTGLYKVDQLLNITKYTSENSSLTSNSLRNIHIDESNNIWVALYMPYNILKITGSNWTIYNSPGNIDQTIWSLVTDKDSNLWIGKGWDNETETLVRFNGDVWETINPRNDKDEMVLGTVRHLLSDTKRLYVDVVPKENNTHQLLAFDGVKWNLISGFPEFTPSTHFITDLTIDYNKQVLWITVANLGLYKLDL